MNAPYKPDLDLEKRLSRRLLDVFIRAGLVFALTLLCYRIFAPFISLMAWALILAVTLYPAHQKLARRMGGKQGRAATLLVLGGIVLIGVPTAVLMASLGDSVHDFVGSVRDNTLKIPAPPAERCRVAGRRREGPWSLVAGPCGSAGSRSEHAAAARRPGHEGAGGGCQHRRRAAAVPGLVHHCRDHHGLRPVGRPRAPGPSSIASWASGAAQNSQRFPRRPFVRWHWAFSGWPSSRPSSLASC